VLLPATSERTLPTSDRFGSPRAQRRLREVGRQTPARPGVTALKAEKGCSKDQLSGGVKGVEAAGSGLTQLALGEGRIENSRGTVSFPWGGRLIGCYGE